MPKEYVLVVEDDNQHQREWMERLAVRYPRQGEVNITICSNAIEAWAVVHQMHSALKVWPRWIAVDHDLQWGNGFELINNLKALGYPNKFIAASGIEGNNMRMFAAGAEFICQGKALDGNLTTVLNTIEKM